MSRALAVALILLAACADAGPGAADARPASDATSSPADAASSSADASARPDADRGDCLSQVPTDFGTPTPFDTFQSESDGRYTYFADLMPESEPFQRLFVAARPDTGVFSGAVEPGTYTIEGLETDYQYCGACVYLAVSTGQSPSTLYMARAGKLRIDSAGAEIHGELTSASLRQIEIEYTGDSCEGGGEWPCGNTGCSGGRCGVQVEGPDCATFVDSLSF